MSKNSYDNYESDFSQSSKSLQSDSNMKLQLYKFLNDKGIVDKLKSQIRQNLILEISSKESLGNVAGSQSRLNSHEIDIFKHSCFSSIYEFFINHDLSYTLSVFLPEIGLNKDQIYSFYEIIKILGLNTSSEFYRMLESFISKDGKSFLWALLKTVSEIHGPNKREMDVQTEKAEQFVPISEKMDKLEFVYETRQREGLLKSQNIFEERMASYRRELEKRMKLEMDNEIDRFKSQEISVLKLKEEQFYSDLLKKKTKSLEDEYQQRLLSLKDRERQSQETLLKVRESQDRESYLERQQLIRDMHNIQSRELEVKKQHDQYERELQMMREQHQMKMDKLEAKEAKLRELEMGLELKIQQEITNNKLDEERKLVQKWKEVEILEAKIQEESKYVSQQNKLTNQLKQELQMKQAQFTEMELIGYPVLKQRNATLEARIEDLEKEISQQTSINQQDKHKIDSLLKQSMEPSFEQAVVLNELERSREAFKREKQIIEQQKESLEQRLIEEIRQRKLLTEQYSEQRDLIESLTRKISMANEYRDKINQSYYGTSARSARYPPLSTSRSQHRSNSPNIDNNPNNPSLFDDAHNYYDPNLLQDHMDQTKLRLLNLDQQTEQLYKSYQDFRNNLSSDVNLPDAQMNDQHTAASIYPVELIQPNHPFEQGRKQSRQLLQIKSPINQMTHTFFDGEYPKSKSLSSPSSPMHHRPTSEFSDSPTRTSVKIQGNGSESDQSDNQEENHESITDDISEHSQSVIKLDNQWKHNQEVASSALQTQNQQLLSSPLHRPQESQVIEATSNQTNFDNSAVNIAKEHRQVVMDTVDDENIDPVVRQYMDLVKKQQAQQQQQQKQQQSALQPIESSSSIAPTKQTSLKQSEPIESDIEESIATISGDADVKNDKSKSSEADSFW